jgi:hypothetical protein
VIPVPSPMPLAQKLSECLMRDEEDYNIIEPPLIEMGEFPPFPESSLVMVHELKDYPLPWEYIRFFNYGFTIGPDPWVSTLKKMLSVL